LNRVDFQIVVVLVANVRNGAECLKKEGFPVENIELFTCEFNELGEQAIGLALGIAAEKRWHDQEKALED
jgi:hypothetical protein